MEPFQDNNRQFEDLDNQDQGFSIMSPTNQCMLLTNKQATQDLNQNLNNQNSNKFDLQIQQTSDKLFPAFNFDTGNGNNNNNFQDNQQQLGQEQNQQEQQQHYQQQQQLNNLNNQQQQQQQQINEQQQKQLQLQQEQESQKQWELFNKEMNDANVDINLLGDQNPQQQQQLQIQDSNLNFQNISENPNNNLKFSLKTESNLNNFNLNNNIKENKNLEKINQNLQQNKNKAEFSNNNNINNNLQNNHFESQEINANNNNNYNEDDDQGAFKDENQKRRRARNDPNNRDYQCPCGKSYLSYPAVYTHVKQKHGGVPPGEIRRPNNQNSKRGRPVGKTTMPKDQDEEDFENESIASNEALGQIDELSLYIHTQVGPSAILVDNRSHKQQELQDCFPKSEFFGEGLEGEQYYKEIYEIFVQIIENEEQVIGEKKMDQNGLYNTNCNTIFAQFLFKASQHLQSDIIRELAVYLCFFRQTLNRYGWDLKKSILLEENKQNEAQNLQINQEYCSINGASEVLEMSNKFITQELPILFNKFQNKTQNFKLINDKQIMTRVVQITNHFCKWLYYKQYTHSQLQMNDTDQMEDF